MLLVSNERQKELGIHIIPETINSLKEDREAMMRGEGVKTPIGVKWGLNDHLEEGDEPKLFSYRCVVILN